ncbi:signal peptidase II [Bosea sp. (in: a-proteobacteria)]|jgi:signal peptidase II|uniref:signal peptidase II n=1 Tax=Bosea sp. (in: a-proteobacteria) TaxID=1871050 RepID=UPI0027329366|nr:signal peptidase II [Bosea sp. (in: a-proteobacteria)]MDP3407099.1 signal peptidase II [Bosea sp. (in: a-proteobacteria)]
MTSARRLGLAVVLVVFLADQALKLWLLFGLRLAETGPFAVTPFMNIVLAWNRGISYGLFQQHSDIGRWGLVVISIVAAIWLGRWMWREERPLTVIGLALIVGGALGNGLDRAVYGAVVDFVHLHWGSFSWYIFNIADAAIVVGVVALLYESFRPGAETPA